ncbi:MAG: ComEC/Rec2 family competence protein [Candidatus Brocadiales bacterium]
MDVWKALAAWTACVVLSLPILVPNIVVGYPEDRLRIHVLDVGQADCIVIESPQGKVMVVDVGEDNRRAGKEAEILHKYLRDSVHKYNIDYLLVTHYHEDHMGWPRDVTPTGLAYLLRMPDIRIKKVIDRGLEIPSRSRLFHVYREWVKDIGVKREAVDFWARVSGRHKQIDLGDHVSIDVIAFNSRFDKSKAAASMVLSDPEEQRQASEHNFSIVFVIHYKKFDMYFGGDICGYDRAPLHNIEERFVHRLKEVEVMKVSDHGSVWATRHELLEVLRPEVSIVSCGRRSSIPARETVEKLLGYKDRRTGRPLGSDIYQTGGEDGFILHKPYPGTGKVQTITGTPIVIETDGRRAFWVRYKGIEQEYLLDEVDIYRNN